MISSSLNWLNSYGTIMYAWGFLLSNSTMYEKRPNLFATFASTLVLVKAFQYIFFPVIISLSGFGIPL